MKHYTCLVCFGDTKANGWCASHSEEPMEDVTVCPRTGEKKAEWKEDLSKGEEPEK